MAEEHAGHRQRMRERFAQSGLEGFAPHEKLELLLFYAIPQRDVGPLTHRLLTRFGTLEGVMSASRDELCKVEGMGPYAASLVALVHQLTQAQERSKPNAQPMLRNHGDAKRHCEQLLRGLAEEHLYAVCMNAKTEVVCDVLLSRGTVGEVAVSPRLVAKEVLRCNARMVVLCHNHPGGNLTPSVQDLEMTRELGTLLSGLDVLLADHIIVGDDASVSLFEAGLIAHASTARPSEKEWTK